MTPPVALTIAGSDSGGGAGIQADLRTFAALRVFATTAITAVTAQNSTGVRAIHALPAEAVATQVHAVLDDFPVMAVKTGMLANPGTVEVVAELAAAGLLPNLVVDPVLVASSGSRLATPDTLGAYRTHLLRFAQVLTPNLPEASALLGKDLHTSAERRAAACSLGQLTGGAVVVTGGHGDDSTHAVDVVWDGTQVYEHRRRKIPTSNTHGSGCSFAAAITAGLACSLELGAAIEAAGDFVHRAIEGGRDWRLGAGHGPLDHLGWTSCATTAQ